MKLTVAKVGGSLFDLPDLAMRLRQWMEPIPGPLLLVPGGGEGADVIRRLDRIQRIGEESAHWLALRVLSLNAELLAAVIQGEVVPTPQAIWSRVSVLDAHAFCQADVGQAGELEHSWRVTSDAIAARVAEIARADLVLLKSIDVSTGMSWQAAAAAGMVDEVFPTIVERANLQVTWRNLRKDL